MKKPHEGQEGPDTQTPYHRIHETLVKDGLLTPGGEDTWRVACHPFVLSSDLWRTLEGLGQHLLAFYRSLNSLYLESRKGTQPAWVREYCDLGKPPELLEFSRMNRFKHQVPGVIRPDLIPTESGLALTELDSVPGGFGLTGSLSRIYASQGDSIWPDPEGLVKEFSAMLADTLQGKPRCLAIVVSDEAEGYRAEMQWMAAQLHRQGWKAYCVHPRDIHFTEEGLSVHQEGQRHPISLIYRFYELFDLKNIPKAELIMYAAKKGQVIITPPYKPWMEEKLALALFHHPTLESYWDTTLGTETKACLDALIPRTWILDPRPVPPSAIIPNLRYRDRPVADWNWLGETTQKERHFVLKVSGFSEQAWGSRGVAVGHDLSQSAWKDRVDSALETFPDNPSVLQEFHKGRVFVVEYYDSRTGEKRSMEGRARLSPYYFVRGDRAKLGGVLATLCPKDKKIIHGMRDAVMTPCRIEAAEEC